MKNQIIIIGGGSSFRDLSHSLEFYKNCDIDEEKNYKRWKDWLMWSLEDQYDFIFPKFPTRDNSVYEIWKIIFEKYLTKLTSENQIFINHSLGTIFIIKYLIENSFSKKIKQLHLVAPIISNSFQPVNDVEDTGSFTFDIDKIKDIEKYCEEIIIWHSTDDTMCDYKNAEFIKEKIPNSILHTFTNRGHFSQSTFLELFDGLRII